MHVNNHKIHLTRNQRGTELSLKNEHKIQAREDDKTIQKVFLLLTMTCLARALSECRWENFKIKAHLIQKKTIMLMEFFHFASITLDCRSCN